MTTAATINASLVLDTKSFDSGLLGAGRMADTFETRMKNIGRSMTQIGTGMTIGLTVPIAAFGASSVKSSMEAESSLADLNATIASTGGVAGVTAEQVTAIASAFQKTTKFSDETIVNGAAMLLTFTNIGKDVFPEATEAILNMGEKFGSVDAAAMQVGKALQDPISGVTALRRVGVMLTDAQEEQIKKFMEAGDAASAQRIILKELETEFGGSR